MFWQLVSYGLLAILVVSESYAVRAVVREIRRERKERVALAKRVDDLVTLMERLTTSSTRLVGQVGSVQDQVSFLERHVQAHLGMFPPVDVQDVQQTFDRLLAESQGPVKASPPIETLPQPSLFARLTNDD